MTDTTDTFTALTDYYRLVSRSEHYGQIHREWIDADIRARRIRSAWLTRDEARTEAIATLEQRVLDSDAARRGAGAEAIAREVLEVSDDEEPAFPPTVQIELSAGFAEQTVQELRRAGLAGIADVIAEQLPW